jgi:hypothetical protein
MYRYTTTAIHYSIIQLHCTNSSTHSYLHIFQFCFFIFLQNVPVTIQSKKDVDHVLQPVETTHPVTIQSKKHVDSLMQPVHTTHPVTLHSRKKVYLCSESKLLVSTKQYFLSNFILRFNFLLFTFGISESQIP